jgi:hypothetical protein
MDNLTLSVATINAYMGSCPTFYKRLMSELRRTAFPDVLCIQEAPAASCILGSEIGTYYKLVCTSENPIREEERLLTLVLRDSPWTGAWGKTVITGRGETVKVAQVCGFLAPGKNWIYIGNVHLQGGRDEDQLYAGTGPRAIYSMKGEPVQRICYADIILGDFNSLENPFDDPDYVRYMRGLGWTDEGIRAWNDTPFSVLRRCNFCRVPYEAPTTVYNNTPDHVTHGDRLQYESFDTLDMDAGVVGASDHNGIVATFSLRV